MWKMNIKLKKGQRLLILTGQPTEFIHTSNPVSTPPYLHNGVSISVTAEEFEMTADEIVSVNTADMVSDGNSNIFRNLIGGRPRNMFKR